MAEDEALHIIEPEQVTTREAGLEQSSAVDPEGLVGVTLAGRYQIEAQIGKGGMGVVYLASQRALNRKVVVKVLGRGVSDEGEAVQRFEREALGLSQLTHPNIVTIYDFGRDQDVAYIVMEYVHGEMLSEAMRRAPGMDFEVFAPIAAQILAALSEAHARGIIHRDIKPSNIMLTERHGTPNFVKVLDFGLVKLVDDAAEVTKKQNLVGSVAFLAPEQILGMEFDQRVDVYALGVLFYYMLTGQKPFVGEDDIAVLYQHIHRDAPHLADVLPPGHDVPDGVLDLIASCLAKDPQERPQDASEMLQTMQSHASRSNFALPWHSGEFSAVSREIAMGRPPTGEYRSVSLGASQLTPSSQRQIPSLMRDSSGSFAPISQADIPLDPQQISRQLPRPTGEHEAILAPAEGAPSSRLALIVAAALLFVVVISGVGGMLYLSRTTPGVDPAQAAIEERERLERVFAEADTLLEDAKWGQAELMLSSVSESARRHPELLRELAQREDRLAIGRLMQQAQLAEKSNDSSAAMRHYRDVAARAPQHAEALAAIARLEAASRPARLTITSPAPATVLLDGQPVGQTPLELDASPGAHQIVLRAEGFEEWQQQLDLSAAEQATLDASLTPLARKNIAAPVKSNKAGRAPSSSTTSSEKRDAEPAQEEKKSLIPVEKPRKEGRSGADDLLPVGD